MSTYPLREYIGSRSRLRVLGLWKMTDFRTLRSFFMAPFLTALRALCAFFVSLPASKPQNVGSSGIHTTARSTNSLITILKLMYTI